MGAAGTPILTAPLPQERGGNNSFTHEALTLKYKLDNQFELVFVVSDPPPGTPVVAGGSLQPPSAPRPEGRGLPKKRGGTVPAVLRFEQTAVCIVWGWTSAPRLVWPLCLWDFGG